MVVYWDYRPEISRGITVQLYFGLARLILERDYGVVDGVKTDRAVKEMNINFLHILTRRSDI